MNRRRFIAESIALSGLAVYGGAAARSQAQQQLQDVAPFELDEMTVTALQDGMKSGRYTARAITESYLHRIEQLDKQGPSLHAIIETNADALQIADYLDGERKSKGARGPLHGIPVLLKDNIDTKDTMTTTAGSLALQGSIPLQDSFVARKLREAGATFLAKPTSANGRTSARRIRQAGGAHEAASAAIPMFSIGIRAVRVRDRLARRPRIWRRFRSDPKPMVRLCPRRARAALSESSRRWV